MVMINNTYLTLSIEIMHFEGKPLLHPSNPKQVGYKHDKAIIT